MPDHYCFICGHYLAEAYALTPKNKKIFIGDHQGNNTFSHKDQNGNTIEYEEDDTEYEWGCNFCDRTFTTEFGCGVHEKSCKQNKIKNTYVKQTKNDSCYRCGRPGHYSPDCYAKTDNRGYTLDSESDEDSE